MRTASRASLAWAIELGCWTGVRAGARAGEAAIGQRRPSYTRPSRDGPLRTEPPAARSRHHHRRAPAGARRRRQRKDAGHHPPHRPPARQRRVPARAILAVTFTNKAAAEMKERVVHMAGPRAQARHRLHLPRLRRRGAPRAHPPARLAEEVRHRRHGRPAGPHPARACASGSIDDRRLRRRARSSPLISRAKNSGRGARSRKPEGMGDDYDLVAAEVFPLYQLALKAQGAVDFDDLLVLPLAPLPRAPRGPAAKYIRRFRYLLVDEFQDTNGAQLELLQLARRRAPQRLRGGRRRPVHLQLARRRGAEHPRASSSAFPGAKEVRLEQNYRSRAGGARRGQRGHREEPRAQGRSGCGPTRWAGARVQLVVAAPTRTRRRRYVAHEIEQQLARGMPARRHRGPLPHQRPVAADRGGAAREAASATRWWAAPSSSTGAR